MKAPEVVMTLGQFLIKELRKYGANHVFGIPGDYTLNFIKDVENDDETEWVGMSREDSVGYAADAYARLNGCGVACVTYSVGGMNVMNPVAGAFAERSPVVVLTGKPNPEDLEAFPYKHHTIDDEYTQKNIFDNVVCCTATLGGEGDILTDMGRISYSLQMMKYYSRPIYIEFSNKSIMQEITDEDIRAFYGYNPPLFDKKSREAPDAIFEEISRSFINAENRVIILGHEMFRTNLEHIVTEFADKLNIPVFTTVLGKSTINEYHPISMGCVSQLMSSEEIMEELGKSDYIITMGMSNTDVDGFIFTPNFSINMNDGVSINGEGVGYPDFRDTVTQFCKKFGEFTVPQDRNLLNTWRDIRPPKQVEKPKGITLEYIFDSVGKGLRDNHIVISDIGESLFGMVDVPVRHGQFMCMAYYTSMSFSVPGAVGAKFAKPDKRPIVIVGDGAFQMTGSEFCSHVRYGVNSIIIILNNRGYSTERAIMEGDFNDVHNWQYEKITDLMNGGRGYWSGTVEGFDWMFKKALGDEDDSYVLNVQIDPSDQSDVMKSIAHKMCQKSL